MSIYYSFRGMRAGDDKELLKKSLVEGDSALVRYIESKPINPMLAYAIGVRGKYKFISGEKEFNFKPCLLKFFLCFDHKKSMHLVLKCKWSCFHAYTSRPSRSL